MLGELANWHAIREQYPLHHLTFQIGNGWPEASSKPEACRFSGGVLGDWLRSNTGTIHTFQGQEADTVILLLGGDPAKKGARDWAIGKPNVLNVAVTRAKRRLYIVGNHAHWKAAGHFETLAPSVTEIERPQMTGDDRDFMQRSILGVTRHRIDHGNSLGCYGWRCFTVSLSTAVCRLALLGTDPTIVRRQGSTGEDLETRRWLSKTKMAAC